jgi:YidC/Oxa1 family membrane protein insertase
MPNFSQLFVTLLTQLYGVVGDLGLTIILFTIVMRLVLLPLTLPSIKAQKKMQDLKPEIDALKKKHGKDKQAFQMAQLELYKRYNINPLAGCIPQLAQLVVLILLYQALTVFIGQNMINGVAVDPSFFWLDLAQPDANYVIPVLAGVSQLVLSLMIAPGAEVKDVVPNKSKVKSVKEANKKEEDVAEMAASMQQQMLYIMPVMTAFIALRFPSGLGLYWIVTTLFSIVQQYAISGPGGLKTYLVRARALVTRQ